jgi:N-ethylmaleimide reductase
MSNALLFAPAKLGNLTLKNHMVMSPMTRNRATVDHTPTAIMAEYYGQRAGAGLIVSEGIGPSANGTGYARIPGIWTEAQVAAWKPVTAAVHQRGGVIFAQLMHTGRVSHPVHMAPGSKVVAPSALQLAGEIYTDTLGMQPHAVPAAFTAAELVATRDEYVLAAKNAIAAGFDGVELHGANGYLLEQFISPTTNQRTDEYGGSVDNRIRFVVEVASAVAKAIGGERLGIRLSPFGAFNGMAAYPEIEETYTKLVAAFDKAGLAYIHVLDHSAMGAPPVPAALKAKLKAMWPRTFIAAGGFDKATGEAALEAKQADLIAYGRPFVSNPDLVVRMQKDVALTPPDFGTFYTPGEKGYTDYPAAT